MVSRRAYMANRRFAQNLYLLGCELLPGFQQNNEGVFTFGIPPIFTEHASFMSSYSIHWILWEIFLSQVVVENKTISAFGFCLVFQSPPCQEQNMTSVLISISFFWEKCCQFRLDDFRDRTFLMWVSNIFQKQNLGQNKNIPKQHKHFSAKCGKKSDRVIFHWTTWRFGVFPNFHVTLNRKHLPTSFLEANPNEMVITNSSSWTMDLVDLFHQRFFSPT